MSLIGGPLGKHKLEGIGGATSKMILAVLSGNPGTTWMTVGIVGSIVNWILTKIFSGLASVGLVMLNVGAEAVSTAVDKVNYDGSWESAELMMKAIRDSGRDMTPEEVQAIDQKVIDAFRKFAHFARKGKKK